MTKDKKKIKKNIKKNVKKHIKRNIRKPLTEEQKATQIEMMKTILSRQPNTLQAIDPQYRDLLQKNQQLNELKNKREFELNNMKKSIDDNERILKNISEERKNIEQMNKENKRKAEFQKQSDNLLFKKNDVTFQKQTLEGKTQLGQVLKEKRELKTQSHEIQHENEKLKQDIEKNKMYHNYRIADEDLRVLQAQNDALKNTINSPEFKNPDEAYRNKLIEIEKKKIEVEHQKKVNQKLLELRDGEAEFQAQREIYFAYKRGKYKTQARDAQGNLLYKKKPDGTFLLDDKGKKIPVMVENPMTSNFSTDALQLAAFEEQLAKQENDIKYYESLNHMRTRLQEELTDARETGVLRQIKLDTMRKINEEQHENDAAITDELKEHLKKRANTDIDIENQEEFNKQLSDLQKERNREEFLKARELSLNNPTHIYQQMEIAQKKLEAENLKKQNELKEVELQAREAEQRLRDRNLTLDIIASTGAAISPETMGQVVAQINEKENKQLKRQIDKSLLLNEGTVLHRQFDEKYGNDAYNIYSGVLLNAGVEVPNASMDERQISAINDLLRDAYEKISPGVDENANDYYKQYVQSDEYKNFFSNWEREHPE